MKLATLTKLVKDIVLQVMAEVKGSVAGDEDIDIEDVSVASTPKVRVGKKATKVTPKVKGSTKSKAKTSAGRSPGSIFVKDGVIRPYMVGTDGIGYRVGFTEDGEAKCNNRSVLAILAKNPKVLQKVFDLYNERIS